MVRAACCCLVVGASLALGACSDGKTIDPADVYLGAAEAREKAVCDCQPADGPDCVEQMKERYPLTPPNGESEQAYEERLDTDQRARLVALRNQTERCATVMRVVQSPRANARHAYTPDGKLIVPPPPAHPR